MINQAFSKERRAWFSSSQGTIVWKFSHSPHTCRIEYVNASSYDTIMIISLGSDLFGRKPKQALIISRCTELHLRNVSIRIWWYNYVTSPLSMKFIRTYNTRRVKGTEDVLFSRDEASLSLTRDSCIVVASMPTVSWKLYGCLFFPKKVLVQIVALYRSLKMSPVKIWPAQVSLALLRSNTWLTLVGAIFNTMYVAFIPDHHILNRARMENQLFTTRNKQASASSNMIEKVVVESSGIRLGLLRGA